MIIFIMLLIMNLCAETQKMKIDAKDLKGIKKQFNIVIRDIYRHITNLRKGRGEVEEEIDQIEKKVDNPLRLNYRAKDIKTDGGKKYKKKWGDDVQDVLWYAEEEKLGRTADSPISLRTMGANLSMGDNSIYAINFATGNHLYISSITANSSNNNILEVLSATNFDSSIRVKSNQRFYLCDPGDNSTYMQHYYSATPSNDYIEFKINDDQMLLLDKDNERISTDENVILTGRLGIGTTNPRYELDADSVIRSTGIIVLNGWVCIGTNTYTSNEKIHLEGNFNMDGYELIASTVTAGVLTGTATCSEDAKLLDGKDSPTFYHVAGDELEGAMDVNNQNVNNAVLVAPSLSGHSAWAYVTDTGNNIMNRFYATDSSRGINVVQHPNVSTYDGLKGSNYSHGNSNNLTSIGYGTIGVFAGDDEMYISHFKVGGGTDVDKLWINFRDVRFTDAYLSAIDSATIQRVVLSSITAISTENTICLQNTLDMNANAIIDIDWANADDGAGSSLDADLLDGEEGSVYSKLYDTQTFTGQNTFNNQVTISSSLIVFTNIELGSWDGLSRNQIWNYNTNSILRLGASTGDGDASDVTSEGIVVWGKNFIDDTMDSNDRGYARVKSDRFGLYNADEDGYSEYLFELDLSEDSFYLRNNSGTTVFDFKRATQELIIGGNIKCSSITITGAAITPNLTSYYSLDTDLFDGSDRSEFALLIDSPTWTGQHTFNNEVIFSSNIKVSGEVVMTTSTPNTDGLYYIKTNTGDRIVIEHQDTSALQNHPLVWIKDKRTTAGGANTGGEAALRIDADGSYSLYIEDGGVFIAGASNLVTSGYIRMNDDVSFYEGTGFENMTWYDSNGTGDDIWYARMRGMTLAYGYVDAWVNLNNCGTFNDWVSPGNFWTHADGGDTNDFSYITFAKPNPGKDISTTHYWDIYMATGAADGTIDSTTQELYGILRVANPNDFNTATHISSGMLVCVDLETDKNVYFDGDIYAGTITTKGIEVFFSTNVTVRGELKIESNLNTNGKYLISGSGTTGLAVDSSGRVGIGVTDPDTIFEVRDAGAGVEFNMNSAAGYGTYTRYKEDDTEIWQVGNNAGAGDDFTWENSSSDEVMNLDQNGHLTIDGSLVVGYGVNAATVIAKDSNGLKLYEDGGEGIFVEDGGDIGIGTESPGALLHIDENKSWEYTIEVYNNNSTGLGQYMYTNNSASNVDSLRIDNSAGNIFMIKSDGGVGIGDSTPTESTLVVNGTVTAQGFVQTCSIYTGTSAVSLVNSIAAEEGHSGDWQPLDHDSLPGNSKYERTYLSKQFQHKVSSEIFNSFPPGEDINDYNIITDTITFTGQDIGATINLLIKCIQDINADIEVLKSQ